MQINTTNTTIGHTQFSPTSINTKQEENTMESIIEDLNNYNNTNNDDVMFIDLLEKMMFSMSTSEKINISQDGQNLIDALDNEINKLNGYNSYANQDVNSDDSKSNVVNKINKLKQEMLASLDEARKSEILIEISLLEVQLIDLSI